MKITATTLYNLVACPKRVELDAFGNPNERDEISPFVKMLWEKGSIFEDEVIEALDEDFLDCSHLEGNEKETATLEAMKAGIPLIYSGRISADELLGIPDILRKEAGGYIPGDIKSGAGEEGGDENNDPKPKLDYAVQLALYVDILERLGLSGGRRAFIWDVHGEEVTYNFEEPRSIRNSQTLWDEYQSTLSDARQILSKAHKPRGAYCASCKMCVWYSHCVKELKLDDDLTLIPQLGRSKRDAMIDYIPTISDLAEANIQSYINGKKTIFKGIGPETLLTYHERAKLLKDPTAKPYIKSPIKLPALQKELFFDIEVDPMRDVCYLHGFVERKNQSNATNWLKMTRM